MPQTSARYAPARKCLRQISELQGASSFGVSWRCASGAAVLARTSARHAVRLLTARPIPKPASMCSV
eukprot:10867420-Prorocentrum_lima.AAC.1